VKARKILNDFFTNIIQLICVLYTFYQKEETHLSTFSKYNNLIFTIKIIFLEALSHVEIFKNMLKLPKN